MTLPQLSGSLFIADGGMETTLIFPRRLGPAALRRRRLPDLTVGGGCGTDERHIGEMCRAVLAGSQKFS